MKFYYYCASVLKQLETQKLGFKTVIFQHSKVNFFPKLYALMNSLMQNKNIINDIFHFLQQKGSIQNEYLMKVLIHEIFIRQIKFKMGGALMKLIKQNKSTIFLKFDIEKQTPNQFIKKNVSFRILPNIDTQQLQLILQFAQKDDLIDNLYHMPYQQYSQFNKEQFNLYNHPQIVIQSKSSSLPVFILKQNFPDIKGDILESCSAPGNKTLQIYEYFENNKVYSFELNEKRFKLLDKRMKFYKSCFKNQGRIYNQDFFKSINNKDININDVQMVVIDPSCSGSGMLNNLKNFENLQQKTQNFEEFIEQRYLNLNQKDQNQVISLANQQKEFISFCIKNFKNLKSIVYSTCSIYKQENEDVVYYILQNFPNVSLVNILPNHKIRGINYYNDILGNEMNKCIRETNQDLQTDGFFVALFEIKQFQLIKLNL